MTPSEAVIVSLVVVGLLFLLSGGVDALFFQQRSRIRDLDDDGEPDRADPPAPEAKPLSVRKRKKLDDLGFH